jgi:hypothetical protein
VRASGTVLTAFTVIGCLSVSAADAACTGSNGRGWASGGGAGQFVMTAADTSCKISVPGFIVGKKRTPASESKITRQPKSGKVTIAQGRGFLYTPNAGFKGKDRFCSSNTSPKFKGQRLAGCVTVTVR